ncbi:MAG: hypothetical protein AB8H86_26190 [Polyangiales bacterium]
MTELERRMLIESNYGRTLGWEVSDEGDKIIATLSDASQVDMFWYRYRVEARSPEAYERRWDGTLTFRNRRTGHVAAHAFAGGERPTPESPYVLMRALYIPVKLRWRERLANFWR